jgi:hypothetical protein
MNVATAYQCPVCGFGKLSEPPKDHNICSCCGTEFGYHDRKKTHRSLRDAWIANGCLWFSKALSPPEGWNPVVQMFHAGLLDVKLGSAGESSQDVGTVFSVPA